MKEIGEYLKQVRTENGVSLEEASDDLNIAKEELENLEEGNIRAFKDIYELKDMVKEYSKYLGIDPDKAMDEFNDFMFEHTSKISLEDIKEARKQKDTEEEKPKVVSPYTYVPKKKFLLKRINWKKVLIPLAIILVIILFVYLWDNFNKEDTKVTDELLGRVSDLNEYAN